MKKVINSICDYPLIDLIYSELLDSCDFIVTESSKTSREEVSKAIKRLNLTNDEYLRIEDLVTSATVSAMDSGFLNGYLIAVKVLNGKML